MGKLGTSHGLSTTASGSRAGAAGRRAASPSAAAGRGSGSSRSNASTIRSASAVTAGRNIVGASKTSVGGAAASVRPASRGSTSTSRPGSSSGVRRPSPRDVSANSIASEPLAKEAQREALAVETAQQTSVQRLAPPLDDELRKAVLGIFAWCDADADGVLSGAEFAAAQRLIAEICPADFDEKAAASIFEKGSEGGPGGLVDEDGFLEAMQELVNALNMPRHDLLQGLRRQTSRRSSAFDHSVSSLKHALVRNVSNLPDEDEPSAPPPQLDIWRTATGGNAFPLPPGAIDDPAAQIAFKMMQYLAMRTEDASFIEGELAARMMGHRQGFKSMFGMCGEIKGVSIVSPGPGPIVADIFLMKSLEAEQIVRVRLTGIRLSAGPTAKLIGMGGFEPECIEVPDVPKALWAQMNAGSTDEKAKPDLSALGTAPPPPGLARQKSMLCDNDLESADLVLTATPVARHLFRIRFMLAEGRMGPAPQYFLLVPRIKTVDTGHPRYADHEIRVRNTGSGLQPEVTTFRNFVVTSVRSHVLTKLVVEHEFTSCRVRVQERSTAKRSDIVPAPTLSPEERANNLADDLAQAARLREVLQARGLARRAGERDIAFAARLGRALRDGYSYDVAATEDHVKNLPPLIWEQRRGDCSAFNAGFVYALRAYGIPARVSLGFKYGKAVQQACGSVVAPHAEAELFAEDIGWIPCDATLGLKRFGHEAGMAGALLSFIEWRPANLSLEEAEELAAVLQPATEPLHQRLHQGLERLFGAERLTAKELAAGLKRVEDMKKEEADRCVAQVLQLSGLAEGDALVDPEQFSRALEAFELGKFHELGIGGPLEASSKAGAKFYEGGPFKGVALERSKLRENMMVPDQIEQVMGHVGGGAAPAPDWASMWPFGVFLCNYEFEEMPLK